MKNLNLDLCITLRCNNYCLNCIKFCNKDKTTGLDYSDSDMTMEQINNFINQVKTLDTKNLFTSITVTGGEPLLHPDIKEIMIKLEELKKLSYVKILWINSNKIIKAPESLKKYIVNYSEVDKKPQIHNVALLHPSDFNGKTMAYKTCKHYRKKTIVLTYMGYSICCAADGYIRLFGMKDLISDKLPTYKLIKKMDKICKHCPFGNDDILPFEKDIGCPVSDIYKKEAEKNRLGRKITKRFGVK